MSTPPPKVPKIKVRDHQSSLWETNKFIRFTYGAVHVRDSDQAHAWPYSNRTGRSPPTIDDDCTTAACMEPPPVLSHLCALAPPWGHMKLGRKHTTGSEECLDTQVKVWWPSSFLLLSCIQKSTSPAMMIGCKWAQLTWQRWHQFCWENSLVLSVYLSVCLFVSVFVSAFLMFLQQTISFCLVKRKLRRNGKFKLFDVLYNEMSMEYNVAA